jgi:hypothetical protein
MVGTRCRGSVTLKQEGDSSDVIGVLCGFDRMRLRGTLRALYQPYHLTPKGRTVITALLTARQRCIHRLSVVRSPHSFRSINSPFPRRSHLRYGPDSLQFKPQRACS